MSARVGFGMAAVLAFACGSGTGGAGGESTGSATGGDDEQSSAGFLNPEDGDEESSVAPPVDEDLSSTDELIDEVDDAPAAPTECARDTYNAERVDVNLYLVLDISGSMSSPIAVDTDVTQWDAVRAAVTEFIESPESAGFNLALNYYPLMGERSNCGPGATCTSDVDCVTTVCDLRFAFADIYTPCGADSECELSIEVDGQTYEEICIQPGRCDNDELELCFLDDQCPTGGTCMISDAVGLCPGEVSCDAAEYSTPSVARSPLPEQAAEMVESLLSKEPDMFSNTPTHVALAGAYREVDQWMQDEPDTRSFVVVATDGAPIGCVPLGTREEVEAEATQRTFDTIQVGSDFGIQTFVIGVFPDLEGLELDPADIAAYQAEVDTLRGKLTDMARIGGTESPFDVTANVNATDAFLDALAEIRGEVLPCEYVIPAPDEGTVAFDKLNVELSSGGDAETILKVDGPGDCAAGEDSWYYNVDEGSQTPTAVVLCPDTCDNANAESGNQIDIVLGCQTIVREVR